MWDSLGKNEWAQHLEAHATPAGLAAEELRGHHSVTELRMFAPIVSPPHEAPQLAAPSEAANAEYLFAHLSGAKPHRLASEHEGEIQWARIACHPAKS